MLDIRGNKPDKLNIYISNHLQSSPYVPVKNINLCKNGPSRGRGSNDIYIFYPQVNQHNSGKIHHVCTKNSLLDSHVRWRCNKLPRKNIILKTFPSPKIDQTMNQRLPRPLTMSQGPAAQVQHSPRSCGPQRW